MRVYFYLHEFSQEMENIPMLKLISAKLAGNIMLTFLALLLLFHVLLLLGAIPQSIAWGGQLDGSSDDIVMFELVAFFVLLFFALIIAIKIGYVNLKLNFVNIGLWVMFAYFFLNTLGNLASSVVIEKLIFTPVTFVLALLSLRLAMEKA